MYRYMYSWGSSWGYWCQRWPATLAVSSVPSVPNETINYKATRGKKHIKWFQDDDIITILSYFLGFWTLFDPFGGCYMWQHNHERSTSNLRYISGYWFETAINRVADHMLESLWIDQTQCHVHRTLWQFHTSIENGPFESSWVFPFTMVMFHSFLCVPEATSYT